MERDFFNQHVLREALGRIGRVPELDDIDYNKRTLSASYQYVIDCFMSLFSAVDELKKEIEHLKINRQTEDEFRAEIWQAIEALQNQDKKPISFANDINPCPPCDCGGITRLTEKVMEQGDYRALYEKEKERWEKLKEFISTSDDYCLPADGFASLILAKELLEKMQELEEG